MLKKLNERLWVYPFEEDRDRPNLSYIKGDKFSLAVDAGHSADHIREFYDALKKEGLPLPSLTVITHWHWDHTLAMHAVNGLTLANETTNLHLAEFAKRIKEEGTAFFLDWDESIKKEYADGKEVIVTLADMTFTGEMNFDLGNCPVHIFQAESPHTDDSTLIYLPDDEFLILGDCTGGEFPSWTFDQAKGDKLAETITKINPKTCLPGHWNELPTEYIIKDLLEGEC